jgi:drug/metabolite transporter (DMT)-like permease
MTSATSALYLRDQRRRGRVFIALAALAWSTAGLLQRELSVGTATQLAGRSLFAVLALIAYVGVAERGRLVKGFRAIGRGGIAVAFFTAVASASFIVALNHTTVANVLFVQALAPIVAAVLGTLLGDPVSRRSWVAMAAGLMGVAVMVGGPGRPSFVGEGLSVVMALAFAGALVITRHRRDVSMAPATCLSQLFVLAVAAPFSHPREIQGHDLTLLILLGVGQIGLGMVFLSIGARLIPAAEVALITLLEVVLGPLWVWLALSETPSAATLAGGAIVMLAVATQALMGTPPSPLRENLGSRQAKGGPASPSVERSTAAAVELRGGRGPH